MNKKEFLEYFDIKDKNEVSKIYERYQVTEYGISSFTDEFCTPNIWNKVVSLKNKLGLTIESIGGFDESERRVLLFIGEYPVDVPIKLYKIENLSKFRELQHKDYLGAIMSIGIKREKIGDLIIKNKFCYFVTFEEIGKIIMNELLMVGNNPVELSIGEDFDLGINLESFSITVSSNRLDTIISGITKKSREECLKLIEKGDVVINYEVIKDKSYKLKEKSVITIKKYGKFRYENITGSTKKDKVRMEIKKFV